MIGSVRGIQSATEKLEDRVDSVSGSLESLDAVVADRHLVRVDDQHVADPDVVLARIASRGGQNQPDPEGKTARHRRHRRAR